MQQFESTSDVLVNVEYGERHAIRVLKCLGISFEENKATIQYFDKQTTYPGPFSSSSSVDVVCIRELEIEGLSVEAYREARKSMIVSL